MKAPAPTAKQPLRSMQAIGSALDNLRTALRRTQPPRSGSQPRGNKAPFSLHYGQPCPVEDPATDFMAFDAELSHYREQGQRLLDRYRRR